MIYFIQSGSDGPIKIGHTDNPVEERLKALQAATPEKLFLLGVIEGSHRDEIQLHKKFIVYQIRQEWFRPGEDLLYYINANNGDGRDSFNEPEYFDNGIPLDRSLEMIEVKYIKRALANQKNNISKAAKMLGISYRSMRYRLDKYCID